MRPLLAALAALSLPARAAPEAPVLVLLAQPPLDATALAEVLRVYLDGYAIDVRVARDDAPADSLRAQLAGARGAGDAARALAAVRLVGDAGQVEVQLVDRVGDKALVSSIPRPARDEDLYRTVALKVGALLRSALYEVAATPAVQASPSLARLVAAPPAPRPAERAALEASYALTVFPEWGLVGQGVTLGAAVRAGRAELALAGSILGDFGAMRDDVAVTLRAVPLWAALRLRLERARVELAAEIDAELLVVRVQAVSATTPVAPGAVYADPAVGAAGLLRVRIAGPLHLRARLAGALLLADERFDVRGAPVIGLGRWHAGGEIGLAMGLP